MLYLGINQPYGGYIIVVDFGGLVLTIFDGDALGGGQSFGCKKYQLDYRTSRFLILFGALL